MSELEKYTGAEKMGAINLITNSTNQNRITIHIYVLKQPFQLITLVIQ